MSCLVHGFSFQTLAEPFIGAVHEADANGCAVELPDERLCNGEKLAFQAPSSDSRPRTSAK